MKKTAIVLLVSSLSWVACKKKDKDPSKTDFLQEGRWKLSAANLNGFVDLMANLKDCQKDNVYTFNASKTITVDEGLAKCNDSAQQTYTDGNWSLVNNDAQILLNGSSITSGLGSLTGTIVTLNATTLQIKKDTAYSGFSGTINLTFTNNK